MSRAIAISACQAAKASSGAASADVVRDLEVPVRRPDERARPARRAPAGTRPAPPRPCDGPTRAASATTASSAGAGSSSAEAGALERQRLPVEVEDRPAGSPALRRSVARRLRSMVTGSSFRVDPDSVDTRLSCPRPDAVRRHRPGVELDSSLGARRSPDRLALGPRSAAPQPAASLHGGAVIDAGRHGEPRVCAFLNLPDGATTSTSVVGERRFVPGRSEPAARTPSARPLHVGWSFITVHRRPDHDRGVGRSSASSPEQPGGPERRHRRTASIARQRSRL